MYIFLAMRSLNKLGMPPNGAQRKNTPWDGLGICFSFCVRYQPFICLDGEVYSTSPVISSRIPLFFRPYTKDHCYFVETYRSHGKQATGFSVHTHARAFPLPSLSAVLHPLTNRMNRCDLMDGIICSSTAPSSATSSRVSHPLGPVLYGKLFVRKMPSTATKVSASLTPLPVLR